MAASKIKEYFTFSRKERIAVIILLLLLAVVFVLPYFMGSRNVVPIIMQEEWNHQIQKLTRDSSAKEDQEELNGPQYSPKSVNTFSSLFQFDPNTATADDWKKLGLGDKTIHTIENYLTKGGHFGKPEDLQRIYGLKPREFEKLKPYIAIQKVKNRYETTTLKPSSRDHSSYVGREIQHIDINESDTSAWIALPGIGSKLASRIITFRQKIGGFHSVFQVAETYGIPDSTFQKIKPYLETGNTPVKKININTADVNTLKAHPYIKWNIANAIMQFRQQHGDYKTVEDLKQIHSIEEEVYKHIAPYLTVE
ncbi:MAG: helix-hairpin-helix domain-containing protein [Chitinophagaceae bacterium]